MRKTLVAFMRATNDQEGTPVANRAYNCYFAPGGAAVNGTGDYNLTLGKGGANIDNTIAEIEVELLENDAGGLVASMIPTSDTVKRLQFRTALNGAFVDPVGFAVSVYRLSPAIAG